MEQKIFLHKDNNKKQPKSNNPEEEDKKSKISSSIFAQSFTLEEPPNFLNEFTSDYEKDSLSFDSVLEFLFPNKINLYYIE